MDERAKNVVNFIDKQTERNYYGSLTGKLLGDNVSVYCVDEAFYRLLVKYEKRLSETQAKMITELGSTFCKEIKDFKEAVSKIYLKINEIEKKQKVKTSREKRKIIMKVIKEKDESLQNLSHCLKVENGKIKLDDKEE